MSLQIYIACDHAGFHLKEHIVSWLNQSDTHTLPEHIDNIYTIDMGPKTDERCNYPYYAHMVSKLISLNKNSIGIVICGTGIGMSIVCNRYGSIRCALCHDIETAKLAKQHNNANIIALGSRLLSNTTACNILDAFLNSQFEGGRHIDRINQINNINNINPITLEVEKKINNSI